MIVKSNREENLLRFITLFKECEYDKDLLKILYYEIVYYCKKEFGIVERNYYKTWLSEKEHYEYMLEKKKSNNKSSIEFKTYKEKFNKYLNGTIRSFIHQTAEQYLTVHHINEVEYYIPSHLSDWEYNTQKYWIYHQPPNLLYLDFMYHYFIHLIIMIIKDEDKTNLKNQLDKCYNENNNPKLKTYLINNYSDFIKEKLDRIYQNNQKIIKKTWQNQKNMV